jgi:hypothetical protein
MAEQDWPGLGKAHRPYVRMDVVGRDAKALTYLFHLTNPGKVDVYLQGKYKGGNHDLARPEIEDQLRHGGLFGVIPV